MNKEQIIKQLDIELLEKVKKESPNIQGQQIIKDVNFWLSQIGDKFRMLVLHTDYNRYADKPKWQAKVNQKKCRFMVKCLGDTPAEALEMLYIELKKANKI